MIQMNQKEFVMHIFKIAIVIGCISGPFMNFVSTNLLSSLGGFQQYFMAALTSDVVLDPNSFSDYNPFIVLCSILDYSINLFFVKMLLAFFFTNILMGLWWVPMIVHGIFYIVCSLVDLIVQYIKSIVFLSMVIALGPIYIPFLLFKQTKHLFDKWWKYMLQYLFEPVVMVAGLTVIISVATIVLYQMMQGSVCVKCIRNFTLPFHGHSIMNFCIPGFGFWGTSYTGVGYSLLGIANAPLMIIFYLLSYIAKEYTKMVGRIAIALSGGGGGSGNVSTTSQVAQQDLLYKSSKGATTPFLETMRGFGNKIGVTQKSREKSDAKEQGMQKELAKKTTPSGGAGGGAAPAAGGGAAPAAGGGAAPAAGGGAGPADAGGGAGPADAGGGAAAGSSDEVD
jgi:type IV secretory pathway VirB6-like protein